MNIKFSDMIKSLITEAPTKNKLYILGNTLWLSYSPGSGETCILKSNKSYITSKSGDSNFNSIVKGIISWTSYNKPLSKNKIKSIYKIPYYDASSTVDPNQLSVWNEKGKVQPKDRFIVIIKEQDYYVINFFDSKQAATKWK